MSYLSNQMALKDDYLNLFIEKKNCNLVQELNNDVNPKLYLLESRISKEKYRLKVIYHNKQFANGQIIDDVNLFAIRREVDILKRIGEHPNLAKVHDAEVTNNAVYILTEYINKENLMKYVELAESKPLDEQLIWTILRGITEGLEYLHLHEMVVKSLSPSNIAYIPELKQVKLIDYNLNSLELLSTNNRYNSPEIIYKVTELYTKPSRDIWSLGIILLELCVGYKNIPANFFIDIKQQKIELILARTLYSKHLKDVITRCIENEQFRRATIVDIKQYIFLGYKPPKPMPVDVIKMTLSDILSTDNYTLLLSNVDGAHLQEYVAFVKEIKQIYYNNLLNFNLSNANLSNINYEFWILFRNIITEFKNLEYINMANCKLSSTGISTLIEVLAIFPNLKKLDVSRNNLGDNGLMELCKIIKEKKNLEYLNLFRTNITSLSIFEFKRLLLYTKNIDKIICLRSDIISYSNETGLDISGNNISESGYIELFINANNSGKVFNVYYNDQHCNIKSMNQLILTCPNLKFKYVSTSLDENRLRELEKLDPLSEPLLPNTGALVPLRRSSSFHQSNPITTITPYIPEYDVSYVQKELIETKKKNAFIKAKLIDKKDKIIKLKEENQILREELRVFKPDQDRSSYISDNRIVDMNRSNYYDNLTDSNLLVPSAIYGCPYSLDQLKMYNYNAIYEQLCRSTPKLECCWFNDECLPTIVYYPLSDYSLVYNKYKLKWTSNLTFTSKDINNSKHGLPVAFTFTKTDWNNLFILFSIIQPRQLTINLFGDNREIIEELYKIYYLLLGDTRLVFGYSR